MGAQETKKNEKKSSEYNIEQVTSNFSVTNELTLNIC